MDTRYLYPGLGLLAVAALLATITGGSATIKTGGLTDNPDDVACYTSGISGTLVTDFGAGTAIVDDTNGRRTVVTWPLLWTGRSSGLEIEIVNRSGKVVARTGTHVNLMGGFWYVDDSFLTCGPGGQ